MGRCDEHASNIEDFLKWTCRQWSEYSRTRSADDKINKKREKIAQLKDEMSKYEKSLEDYVEMGESF